MLLEVIARLSAEDTDCIKGSDLCPAKRGSDGITYSYFIIFIRKIFIDPYSATRHDSHHQSKVKVKGLGRNSSYLARFSIFFSWLYKKVQSVG